MSSWSGYVFLTWFDLVCNFNLPTPILAFDWLLRICLRVFLSSLLLRSTAESKLDVTSLWSKASFSVWVWKRKIQVSPSFSGFFNNLASLLRHHAQPRRRRARLRGAVLQGPHQVPRLHRQLVGHSGERQHHACRCEATRHNHYAWFQIWTRVHGLPVILLIVLCKLDALS